LFPFVPLRGKKKSPEGSFAFPKGDGKTLEETKLRNCNFVLPLFFLVFYYFFVLLWFPIGKRKEGKQNNYSPKGTFSRRETKDFFFPFVSLREKVPFGEGKKKRELPPVKRRETTNTSPSGM
jgi:hypothetical protein